ncbi:MAG: hypothetical protein ACYCQJ_13220 [Nitrososphaerales archaeon]
MDREAVGVRLGKLSCMKIFTKKLFGISESKNGLRETDGPGFARALPPFGRRELSSLVYYSLAV